MKDKITVFLVEDEWMWSEAIVSILKKREDILLLGEAKTAETALVKIKQMKPDVVLMDVRLKGSLSGIDATRAIITSGGRTKVIVFTIDPSEEYLHSAINAGAAGYLLKKEVNDPEILIKAVYEVYNGQAFITPSVTRHVLDLIRDSKKPKNTYGLTGREREIIGHMRSGRTNKEIAYELGIHERTVANHMSNIFRKLDVSNRVEALNKVIDEKLID